MTLLSEYLSLLDTGQPGEANLGAVRGAQVPAATGGNYSVRIDDLLRRRPRLVTEDHTQPMARQDRFLNGVEDGVGPLALGKGKPPLRINHDARGNAHGSASMAVGYGGEQLARCGGEGVAKAQWRSTPTGETGEEGPALLTVQARHVQAEAGVDSHSPVRSPLAPYWHSRSRQRLDVPQHGAP